MNSSSLHIFNPSCETAIANGTISYVPNKTLLQFENELAYLSSVFSKKDDLVLVSEYEDMKHLDLLYSLSFPVPGQILQSDFFNEKQRIISDIDAYRLWGWAPNWIHRLKKNSRVRCPTFENSSFYNWNQIHRNLYSRELASEILSSIISFRKNLTYITPELVAKKLLTIEAVDLFLSKHKKIVLKEPWSSSGRGVMMLRKSNLNTSIIQRIKGVLKQQGFIMAEPMLDKKLDMSMHFELIEGELNYIGVSYFKTNSNGQYQANYINQTGTRDKRLNDFVNFNKSQLIQDLLAAISKSEIIERYEGFFGVDIMVVENQNKLVFQPCVEINLRNNMGTIALHLQKLIHPESKGTFNIVFNPKGVFENSYNHIRRSIRTKDGLLFEGTLSLVSPKGKRFGAYIDLV